MASIYALIICAEFEKGQRIDKTETLTIDTLDRLVTQQKIEEQVISNLFSKKLPAKFQKSELLDQECTKFLGSMSHVSEVFYLIKSLFLFSLTCALCQKAQNMNKSESLPQ